MAENNAKAPEQESNFKALVLPVIVLVVICLVCSALLAVLNDATAPIIEANTKAETLAAYLSVLPEGTTADDLQDVTVTTANVTGAVKTADGMAVVQSTAAGYSGNLVTVYAAFDTTGTLTALSGCFYPDHRYRFQDGRRELLRRLCRLERFPAGRAWQPR